MFATRPDAKLYLFHLLIFLNMICITFYFIYLYKHGSKTPTKNSSTTRVLIFSSDNRAISNDENQFNTLSLVINFLYAQRFQYTFRYFLVNYTNTRNLAQNIPFPPYCYNQILNQERSVHWAKLQVMWYVLQTYSSDYDLFIYIDSDVVFNNHNMSVDTFLSNLSWESSSRCQFSGLNACHFLFFFDPWMRKKNFVVPNSGIFLFQSTLQARHLIQLWWNFDMRESNFHGYYKQDALWNLIKNLPSPAAQPPNSEELTNRIEWNNALKDILIREKLKNYIGILNFTTFGNGNNSQYFVHMTSGLGPDHRQPELFSIWKRLKTSLNQTQFFTQTHKESVIHFDATNDRIPMNSSEFISI